MKVKRTSQVENDYPRHEHIGHITTPIEHVEKVRTVLEPHGVILFKCQTNDNWWTLVLPLNSIQVLQESETQDSFCTVRLPDGYEFQYLPPIIRHDKSYGRFPKIVIK